uniref:BD-FAE-like domain-containing protein n=1 Tax=Ditylum brightwellii TaxID=49249 RepID=A0A7S4T6N9_9STRA|mmetsp:Transcript_6156/g.8056  ORF Transcript_6156/g.8056 Transcript_6156/m.8056 type:complete len:279 (-) Transcript_6156:553-1389(-)
MGAKASKTKSKTEVGSELISVPSIDDGHSIPCKIFKPPKKTTVRGAVFFIHGGMFSQGDRGSHPQVSESLAKLGLLVITASFRDGSSTEYTSGKYMQDLKSIARYFRTQNAQRKKQLPFGIVGSSSGGWFALSLVNELEVGEVDYLALLCPVADPYARAVYLQQCIECPSDFAYHVRHEPEKAKCILENQLKFFSTMENMQEATNAVRTSRHNIPTLMLVGAVDKNVPPQVTQHIQNSWATRTISVGGKGHEIQNVLPLDLVSDIDQFLKFIIKDGSK